ncbi:Transposon Ty3-I Gag-Pol polyprotein [Vitis vinifera]|uniref:Transposon Ty3-I Gag-Pol polyprotein n=1 Tax=Vitis vinifera TaxID=29760 RepID=A0A438FVF1_VITVI|nr:Transposon Ty3-I Gag-Pol polyprotein [Vitis vinifera]
MMTAGRATCIMFSDDDLPPEGSDHMRPLCISVGCSGRRVPFVLLDNGLALNVCPLAIAIALGYAPFDFGPSTQTFELMTIPGERLCMQHSGARYDAKHVLPSRHEERVRAWLIHTPFYYPVRPYTMSLADYFVRASESHALSDGIIGGLNTTQEAELQHLVYLMTLCFPDEIDDHGTFVEISDIFSQGSLSSFDLFGVSTIELAEESLIAPVPEPIEDVIVGDVLFGSHVGVVDGVFDFVDPPFYLTFCRDDDSSSASDLDPIDQRVSPAIGDTEIVDFDPTWTFSHGPMRTYLALIHPSSNIVCHFCPMPDRLSRMVEYPEWLANVVPVPKKDGKVRVCVDFRDLNKASPKDDFPLPHIDMLVDSIAGHSMLSFMDGFFGVMPFRLKNAGATYQRAVTILFHDMMHWDVEVYVDDMIVKSRDRSDHVAALERFFERIRQFRLRLNPKKSLLEKSQPTVWDDQCQRAFERIREYLLSPPVGASYTRPSSTLYLSVSDVALGCMLAQLDDSGKDRAIYYLNPLRYLFDKPALVVAHEMVDEDVAVTSLSGWRMYFDGGQPFWIWDRRLADIPSWASGRLEMRSLGLIIAYLKLLVVRFDDLRYTHLPRAQNQFADALATLASMIDIPADATIRPLLIELRSAPAYYCLIDDTEPDDDHEDWLFLADHGDGCCQFVQKCPSVRYMEISFTCRLRVACIDFTMAVFSVGWVEAASYARLTSSGVASFIRSHIICRYGVPHELILDRGVHFRAEVDTLMQRYGIQHHRSSAYKPQMNGAVEATNKNIKRILWKMVDTSRDWSEKLPYALWAYRTSFCTSTGAHLFIGQIPEADWAQARFDQLNLLDERRLRAATMFAHIRGRWPALSKKRVKPRPLHVGDLVLKVIRGLIRDPRGKFRPNWSGPYFIRELTPEGTAWLTDLDGNRFSEPTNVDQLKRHPQVHGSWDFLYMLLSYTRAWVYDHWTTLRPWDQTSSSIDSAWTGIFPFWMRFVDFYGVACLSHLRDSHFCVIALNYELLMSHQDRPDTFDAILGLMDMEMIVLSQICYSFHHSIEGYRICFTALAFRATISSQSRRSKSSPLFNFGVQSRHHFLVLEFRAISIFHLAFKATISSQSRHSDHQHFPFGVQGHYLFSVLAFRAINIFRLVFRAIISFPISAFRAINIFSLVFQAIIISQLWCSEPPPPFSLAFRAIVRLQFDT